MDNLFNHSIQKTIEQPAQVNHQHQAHDQQQRNSPQKVVQNEMAEYSVFEREDKFINQESIKAWDLYEELQLEEKKKTDNQQSSEDEDQPDQNNHKKKVKSGNPNPLQSRIRTIWPTSSQCHQYYMSFLCPNQQKNQLSSYYDFQKNYHDKLISHDIDIHEYEKNSIKIVFTSQSSKILVFQVSIFFFRIKVEVLNLIKQSSFERYLDNEGQLVGAGTGGIILKLPNIQGVVKKIPIVKNSEGINFIQKFIREYALNKLLSCLQIGPKILKSFHFDIICTSSSFIFCMQQCESFLNFIDGQCKIFSQKMNFLGQKLESDLKESLRLLHSIQIVHYDIKPENIMYSHKYEKFVMIDFGMSELKNFPQKYLELEKFKGTYHYCSEEMKSLFFADRKMRGYVDVYYNDCYCLKKSLQIIKASLTQVQRKNISQNDFNQALLSPISLEYNILDSKDINLKISPQSCNFMSNRHSFTIREEVSFSKASVYYEFQGTDRIEYDFMKYLIELYFLVFKHQDDKIELFLSGKNDWIKRQKKDIERIFYENKVNYMQKKYYVSHLLPYFQCISSNQPYKKFQLEKDPQISFKQLNPGSNQMQKNSSLKTTINEMIFQKSYNSYIQETIPQRNYINSIYKSILIHGQYKFSLNIYRQLYSEMIYELSQTRNKKDQSQHLANLFELKKIHLMFIYINRLQELVCIEDHEPEFQSKINHLVEEIQTLLFLLLDFCHLQFKQLLPFVQQIHNQFNRENCIQLASKSLIILTNMFSAQNSKLDDLIKIKDAARYIILILNIAIEMLQWLQNKDFFNKMQQFHICIFLKILTSRINLFPSKIKEICQLSISYQFANSLHNQTINLQIFDSYDQWKNSIAQVYNSFQCFYFYKFKKLNLQHLSVRPNRLFKLVAEFKTIISNLQFQYQWLFNQIAATKQQFNKKVNKKVFEMLQSNQMLYLLKIPEIQQQVIQFKKIAQILLLRLQLYNSKPKLLIKKIIQVQENAQCIFKSTIKKQDFQKVKRASKDAKNIYNKEDKYIQNIKYKCLYKMGCYDQFITQITGYLRLHQTIYDYTNQLFIEAELNVKYYQYLYFIYKSLGVKKTQAQIKKILVDTLVKLGRKYLRVYSQQLNSNDNKNPNKDFKINNEFKKERRISKDEFIKIYGNSIPEEEVRFDTSSQRQILDNLVDKTFKIRFIKDNKPISYRLYRQQSEVYKMCQSRIAFNQFSLEGDQQRKKEKMLKGQNEEVTDDNQQQKNHKKPNIQVDSLINSLTTLVVPIDNLYNSFEIFQKLIKEILPHQPKETLQLIHFVKTILKERSKILVERLSNLREWNQYNQREVLRVCQKFKQQKQMKSVLMEKQRILMVEVNVLNIYSDKIRQLIDQLIRDNVEVLQSNIKFARQLSLLSFSLSLQIPLLVSKTLQFQHLLNYPNYYLKNLLLFFSNENTKILKPSSECEIFEEFKAKQLQFDYKIQRNQNKGLVRLIRWFKQVKKIDVLKQLSSAGQRWMQTVPDIQFWCKIVLSYVSQVTKLLQFQVNVNDQLNKYFEYLKKSNYTYIEFHTLCQLFLNKENNHCDPIEKDQIRNILYLVSIVFDNLFDYLKKNRMTQMILLNQLVINVGIYQISRMVATKNSQKIYRLINQLGECVNRFKQSTILASKFWVFIIRTIRTVDFFEKVSKDEINFHKDDKQFLHQLLLHYHNRLLHKQMVIMQQQLQSQKFSSYQLIFIIVLCSNIMKKINEKESKDAKEGRQKILQRHDDGKKVMNLIGLMMELIRYSVIKFIYEIAYYPRLWLIEQQQTSYYHLIQSILNHQYNLHSMNFSHQLILRPRVKRRKLKYLAHLKLRKVKLQKTQYPFNDINQRKNKFLKAIFQKVATFQQFK